MPPAAVPPSPRRELATAANATLAKSSLSRSGKSNEMEGRPIEALFLGLPGDERGDACPPDPDVDLDIEDSAFAGDTGAEVNLVLTERGLRCVE